MTEQELNGLRLGTYVRVSTDSQDGGSQNQRATLERFVAKNNLHVIDWYHDDEGYNPRGKRNPEFKRMMTDAEDKRIDGLLIAYTQRLGFIGPDIVTKFLDKIHTLDIPCWDVWEKRDLRECYHDSDLWRRIVDRTIESRKDLEQLARKHLQRRLDYAEQGRIAAGNQAFGIDAVFYNATDEELYRVVHDGSDEQGHFRRWKVMPDGKRHAYHGKRNCVPKDKHARGEPRPTKDDAKLNVVRDMFDWCDREGLSVFQIVSRLNQMQCKSSQGRMWSYCTVEDVLTNSVYIGRPSSCRERCGKYAMIDGSGEIVLVNDPHPKKRPSNIVPIMPAEPLFPPIVDSDVFWRVQERLAKREPSRPKYPVRNPGAWARGIVYCGRCGGKMNYQSRHTAHWRCNKLHRGRAGAGNETGCGGIVKDSVLKDVVESFLLHSKQELQQNQEISKLEYDVASKHAQHDAGDYGTPDPQRVADIDSDMKQHELEIEQTAQRALAMPILTETDTYTKAMNDHKRAIADLRYEKKQLLDRPTAESLLAEIAKGEALLVEGRKREYNQFLNSVISRIVCYNHPLPEGKKRGRGQKYETTHIIVFPYKALPFAIVDGTKWSLVPRFQCAIIRADGSKEDVASSPIIL